MVLKKRPGITTGKILLICLQEKQQCWQGSRMHLRSISFRMDTTLRRNGRNGCCIGCLSQGI